MKTKVYILLIIMLLFGPAAGAFADSTGSEPGRGEKLKAAFVYNFIKFIDWADEEKTEEEKKEDKLEPIIIGIIGKPDFIKAFDPIKKKKIGNRSIIIRYFNTPRRKNSKDKKDPDFEQDINGLKKCTVVIFCNCQETNIQNWSEVLKAMNSSSVLTIGETENFLESGGIINFVIEKKKLKFDINLIAAKKAKLKFRAQLLKLARKVIQKKNGSDKNAKDN
jgi:hypothetical protein